MCSPPPQAMHYYHEFPVKDYPVTLSSAFTEARTTNKKTKAMTDKFVHRPRKRSTEFCCGCIPWW